MGHPRTLLRAFVATLGWVAILTAISVLRLVCHTMTSEDARRVYLLSVVGGEPWEWRCLPRLVRQAARPRTSASVVDALPVTVADGAGL